MKLDFSRQIFEKKYTQISNFIKIRTVGAEFHTDGRTDVTQLIVAFRKLANAPKNVDWIIESFSVLMSRL
jgi:hypothetical protein